MNPGWAEQLSRDRVSRFEQEAQGGLLLRRAQAERESWEPLMETTETEPAFVTSRRLSIAALLGMVVTRGRLGVADFVERTSAWGERR